MADRCGYAAIVGRPNVGKSTLLNRVIGQKLAITSHKPQTTRHTILGVRTLPGGQILYVDTPGIHRRGGNAMNRYLNRAARSVLRDVDVILFVCEALRWTREDQAVLEELRAKSAAVIVAVNKVDRVKDKTALLPFLDDLGRRLENRAIVPVSARTGVNLERLERAVVELLPTGPNLFPADQLTDRSERFLAAELLREQLTRRFSAELPYALTVELERFEEEGRLYRIGAMVWVERESQRKILLSHKGLALKEAAREARLQMERLFGRRVFLEVWIKVKKSWSSDEQALARLGYVD
ncbi:MAG: GTPase Era [Chromatiales bacterium]|jgi:GTP-binding protein Era